MDEKNLGSFCANLPDDPGDQRKWRKNAARRQVPLMVKRIHSLGVGMRLCVPGEKTGKLSIDFGRKPVYLGAKWAFAS
jgi:hypothetical protein